MSFFFSYQHCYNQMCLSIRTVFSGERCGPWASNKIKYPNFLFNLLIFEWLFLVLCFTSWYTNRYKVQRLLVTIIKLSNTRKIQRKMFLVAWFIFLRIYLLFLSFDDDDDDDDDDDEEVSSVQINTTGLIATTQGTHLRYSIYRYTKWLVRSYSKLFVFCLSLIPCSYVFLAKKYTCSKRLEKCTCQLF